MTVVASIDCGTNSTRLLVARARPGQTLETLERHMVITRLGAGVDASGALEPGGVQRTLDVLEDYRRGLDRLEVERVRVTATSATRDASNAEEFFAAAEAILGTRPELITGEEEGRLSFVGATAELDPSTGPFMVVDIGGGSTEFAVGTDEVVGVTSIDVGCVRMTERFLHRDPPGPDELSSAISVTMAYLDDVVRELPQCREANLTVGLAGTISTVAAVEIGLAAYDRDRIHHFRLTHEAAEDVFRTLATESFTDRVHNPGLPADRADVIVGGCCVLVAVMRYFGLDELLVSESDILDGLAMSVLEGV